VEEAVGNAKEYLEGALRAGLNLGSGSGPLNHMWQMGKRIQGFEGCP
jgi:hydroxymethylpyrimidine/phosphomethylpyrimidine kinase